jgi:pyrroline-5-carboxylate reductase
MNNLKISIIGSGNMGGSIARGLLAAKAIPASSLLVTDTRNEALEPFKALGANVSTKNIEAVKFADIVIVAVKPWFVKTVLDEISPVLNSAKQMLVSIAAGISIADVQSSVGDNIPVFRVMPNTAIAIRESMTAIASANATEEQQKQIVAIFEQLGKAVIIHEDMINAATVIGSCETAYALRFIRASIEGGIEIGFTAAMAQTIVTQTVLGAAKLLLENGTHPEAEIDKVCTPKGMTIAGLNEMEHTGFSSSVINGVMAAYKKVAK